MRLDGFGFSYIGLIWLLMLFVPNIIWTKNKPSGYEESDGMMDYSYMDYLLDDYTYIT